MREEDGSDLAVIVENLALSETRFRIQHLLQVSQRDFASRDLDRPAARRQRQVSATFLILASALPSRRALGYARLLRFERSLASD